MHRYRYYISNRIVLVLSARKGAIFDTLGKSAAPASACDSLSSETQEPDEQGEWKYE